MWNCNSSPSVRLNCVVLRKSTGKTLPLLLIIPVSKKKLIKAHRAYMGQYGTSRSRSE
jgi:hypothetical protein